jgi:hypothetical protein
MKKIRKLIVLSTFLALFVVISSITVHAEESGTTSLLGSSEPTISSIVETSTNTTSSIDLENEFESELSKIFSQEVVKYIMYGLSSFGGASGVLLIFGFLFKKWLEMKLKKNDETTNALNTSLIAAKTVLETATSLLDKKDKQFNEVMDKMDKQIEVNEKLTEENMQLKQDIADIKKSLEIVLLRDKETIKRGDGVKVAKTLSSKKEQV